MNQISGISVVITSLYMKMQCCLRFGVLLESYNNLHRSNKTWDLELTLWEFFT